MDKIYSRKRINFPNILNKNKKNNNKHKSIIVRMIAIIIIAMITAYIIIKAITPIINKNCSNMAKSIATKISNEQATIVMNRYKYEDLCTVTKDSNGNIAMISANVIPINEIVSDITIRVQDEFNKSKNNTFNVRLGSFTGLKILAGRGPNVEVKVSTIGSLDTELKSEFISTGINQTVHKIYLKMECNVVILTPFDTYEEKITNQIMLAEAVIVGTTPNTYYNFNGMDKNTIIETIE